MKYFKYSYIILILIVMASCAPYKNIPQLDSFNDLNYRVTVNKIDLSDGIELAYTDEGSGETILFIHGLGSYIPAYDKIIPELSKNYRCIAIDLPRLWKIEQGTTQWYDDLLCRCNS
jgi:hypothetical protein